MKGLDNMRKHCIRKWIHAICDLLPLLVIPIFAIYSHRHTIDNYSVTKEEPFEVSAFQYFYNGLPYDLDGYEEDEGSLYLQNGYIFCDNVLSDNFSFDYFLNDISSFHAGDIFYFTFNVAPTYDDYDDFDQEFFVYFGFSSDTLTFNLHKSSDLYFDSFVSTDFYNDKDINIGCGTRSRIGFKYFQLFNLTEIFGSGNEPTADVFNSYLVQNYYDYGNNTLSFGTHSVTYNDTDIGSQMIYTLYNTCDKYFNFNHVGVFNDLYGWFETNLFNGNVPLSFTIVWNVILFEFVMDLIFLTYMVFMFVIDFTEHLIDGFFDKAYRGGR